MKSRLFLKLQVGAVLVALVTYFGMHAYRTNRCAKAYARSQVGDSPELVTARFGLAPRIETSRSDHEIGFTMLACTLPCAERLIWYDPTAFFQPQAYYFDFDGNRTLIRKTHYLKLDEDFLKWKASLKQAKASN